MPTFKHSILCVAVALLGAQSVFAQTEVTTSASQAATAQHKFEKAMAPIKTEADLTRYVAGHPGKDNPLNLLSTAARQRFIASLVFGVNGLASYEYTDIQSELTLSQNYSLLSLFGMQNAIVALPNARVVTEDDARLAAARTILPQTAVLYDYACFSFATCIRSYNFACSISDCVNTLPE